MAAALFATKGAALGCESDGAVLHRVHATVTIVPSSLAAVHSQRAQALRNLALTLSDAARMYGNSHATLQRSVAAVRDMVRAAAERVRRALRAHEAACAAAERAAMQHVRRCSSFSLKLCLCRAALVCKAVALPRAYVR